MAPLPLDARMAAHVPSRLGDPVTSDKAQLVAAPYTSNRRLEQGSRLERHHHSAGQEPSLQINKLTNKIHGGFARRGATEGVICGRGYQRAKPGFNTSPSAKMFEHDRQAKS